MMMVYKLPRSTICLVHCSSEGFCFDSIFLLVYLQLLLVPNSPEQKRSAGSTSSLAAEKESSREHLQHCCLLFIFFFLSAFELNRCLGCGDQADIRVSSGQGMSRAQACRHTHCTREGPQSQARLPAYWGNERATEHAIAFAWQRWQRSGRSFAKIERCMKIIGWLDRTDMAETINSLRLDLKKNLGLAKMKQQ